MREDSLVTAGLTLMFSLALTAGGLALVLVGGLGVLFALPLIAFGVLGIFQAVVIALGRGPGSDQPSDRSAEEERGGGR